MNRHMNISMNRPVLSECFSTTMITFMRRHAIYCEKEAHNVLPILKQKAMSYKNVKILTLFWFGLSAQEWKGCWCIRLIWSAQIYLQTGTSKSKVEISKVAIDLEYDLDLKMTLTLRNDSDLENDPDLEGNLVHILQSCFCPLLSHFSNT